MRWLLLGLLLPLPVLAQPRIVAENPHGYGWWLGDELVQHIRIDLSDGVSLDPASLPRPRRVDYWLDLRGISARETRDGIELTLSWQNFYSAMEPKRQEVPSSPIRLSNGAEAVLPGFSFVTSPIRPLTAPSSPDQLLPDPEFRLIDPYPHRAGLVGAVFMFVASFAALAWHQAWWPFHARPARPFTRAARRLRRLADPAMQRRLLHRALDAAFGKVMIGEDLSQFLADRPEFASMADRLADFFHGSDAAFFGVGPVVEGDVAALARDLSRIERGQR
ncbi:nonribosomal peptide synthetase MxaA [Paracoccus alkanivorans]|uniref:Nonribosomal peptide synthetase MxaA n=1 Tax=Paracoccus alkanivorans TaxID=2116655 RepID=A0A3M0MZ02_9RHOB|nr:nonribosomal peptide synthetase MxaA [Paracoccus alkanivorans]RMC36617.1 nonribosomal peptide synthetase MxaA [Paracoccus alkanivorans]